MRAVLARTLLDQSEEPDRQQPNTDPDKWHRIRSAARRTATSASAAESCPLTGNGLAGSWVGMNTAQLVSTNREISDVSLRLAIAAYLARYKGQSRVHTESDLRSFLRWCRDRDLDPFQARRPHIELYLRWMQEVQRFQPSTVSRAPLSVGSKSGQLLCESPIKGDAA
jgi:hypothetical protein